jgi:hypothetical protein
MRSLAFKETAFETAKRESRLKRRNHNMSLFLSSRGVKDNRKILLCKRGRGHGGQAFATHVAEGWQRIGMRHCVAQCFVTSAGLYGSLPATSVIPTGVEAGRPSSSKSNLLSE